MLAPNPSSSYNGRPSFVNPKYLKNAQSEKPCLYKIPYDKDDLANIFAPNCDETLILDEENLEYIQSLEKEVDKLESRKAEFSIEYDLLLQECVSKDIMCAILRSLIILMNILRCDLKAKLQDKTIANAEMHESWNKMKGKGVDTNSGKPSILGKPHLQPIRNQPVPQARQSVFAKSHHVNALGPSRNNSNCVSFQSPKESVGLNDMVYNYYLEEAKKKAQLQKDKALNSKT
ncbi:hypothetical protein Tco_0812623 [Tanacetum coccineum]